MPSHGFTLLFRPLAAMEPNSFTALVTDRTGNIVWQEDTDHPSYYEAYDLARRAFAASAASSARTRSHPPEPGRRPDDEDKRIIR